MRDAERPISLNDLPRYSRWPAILLNAAAMPLKSRTTAEVFREYDREKWGKVLASLQQTGKFSDADLLAEQGVDPQAEIAFARGDYFFVAPALQVMGEYEELLTDTLSEFKAEAVIELGCGLGDKVLGVASRLGIKEVYGGEFTPSGVRCGQILSERRKLPAHFQHFDYNDFSTLAGFPEGALIYTSHSIEQIPQLKESFIEGVIGKKPRAVVHLEPCYADHDASGLIGLMRKRYAEVNDYNRNLSGMIRSFENAGRLRVLRHEKNIFSDTPFNPTSIIVWQPA